VAKPFDTSLIRDLLTGVIQGYNKSHPEKALPAEVAQGIVKRAARQIYREARMRGLPPIEEQEHKEMRLRRPPKVRTTRRLPPEEETIRELPLLAAEVYIMHTWASKVAGHVSATYEGNAVVKGLKKYIFHKYVCTRCEVERDNPPRPWWSRPFKKELIIIKLCQEK
jgi:hypothetical protein